MTDLIPATHGELKRNELKLVDGLELNEWKRIGHKFGECQDSVMWWLGDWLNYGERSYGEKYSEARKIFCEEGEGEFSYKDQTMRVAAYVAGRIPPLIRVNNLSFGHHRLVAKFEDRKEITKWLKRASEGKWSVDRLSSELKADAANPIVQNATHEGGKGAVVIFNDINNWFRGQGAFSKWPVTQLQSVKADFDEKIIPKYREIEAELQRRAA